MFLIWNMFKIKVVDLNELCDLSCIIFYMSHFQEIMWIYSDMLQDMFLQYVSIVLYFMLHNTNSN
jgi:hypothetical protein